VICVGGRIKNGGTFIVSCELGVIFTIYSVRVNWSPVWLQVSAEQKVWCLDLT